jgi:hypothetical protein
VSTEACSDDQAENTAQSSSKLCVEAAAAGINERLRAPGLKRQSAFKDRTFSINPL